MRFTGVLFAAMAAPFAFAAPAHAAGGPGDAKVALLPAMSLVKQADLDFGTISAGTAPGSVTIDPASNARSAAGGATLLPGAASRAQFQARAPIGVLVLISQPGPVTLVRSGGGAPSMTASLTYANGAGISSVTVLGIGVSLQATAGTQTFYVGGTLAVGAGQPAGDYSGTFSFTANYL